MGRRIKSNLSTVPNNLIPDWKYLDKFRVLDNQYKEWQKANYDHHYKVRPLPPLAGGTEVYVKTRTQMTSGHTIYQADQPRSYYVSTQLGTVQMNQRHLLLRTNVGPPSMNVSLTPSSNHQPVTHSLTGVPIHLQTDLYTALRKGDVV